MTDKPISTQTSSSSEVAEFLEKLAALPQAGEGDGRLIFALDATASRQRSWDTACQLHAEMFQETARLGGLQIQLAFYRGFREFKVSRWHNTAAKLLRSMTGVTCLGGATQIEKLLRHAISENKKHKVNAVVFIGDCMEEQVDTLCDLSGQLGMLGVPLFLFHEGHDPAATEAFSQMAKLSRGAYCAFNASSARELAELLRAVAAYAAGGKKALLALSSSKVVPRLIKQLEGN